MSINKVTGWKCKAYGKYFHWERKINFWAQDSIRNKWTQYCRLEVWNISKNKVKLRLKSLKLKLKSIKLKLKSLKLRLKNIKLEFCQLN